MSVAHSKESALDSKLAPILLFTYARLEHTKKVVDSLLSNKLAKKSELIIYSDFYKDNADEKTRQKVESVREFIATINGFKKVEIIKRERNFGLADNIIDGVSAVVNRYGKVIVLEDDIVVSSVFLDYMNDALNYYESEPKVWSISAWVYPIDTTGLPDCFFVRLPDCWGWGTWADRWQHFKRDIDWALTSFSKEEIDYINMDGVDKSVWLQVEQNKSGKIKSWAIFNCLASVKHGALSLSPLTSYVRQIGFDGTGVHCGWLYDDSYYNGESLNLTYPITYPTEILEDQMALERIKEHIKSAKKPLWKRAINKAARIMLGARERERERLAPAIDSYYKNRAFATNYTTIYIYTKDFAKDLAKDSSRIYSLAA